MGSRTHSSAVVRATKPAQASQSNYVSLTVGRFFTLSLVTILYGVEINNIEKKTRVRSAITSRCEHVSATLHISSPKGYFVFQRTQHRCTYK